LRTPFDTKAKVGWPSLPVTNRQQTMVLVGGSNEEEHADRTNSPDANPPAITLIIPVIPSA
jgi:hypothetical protein